MPLLSPTNGVKALYENQKTMVSLSILLAIFPGGPGSAGTRMSPFWILLEPRMMDDGGDNRSYKTCTAPVKSQQQHTNTKLF